jgi:hypothetical protein
MAQSRLSQELILPLPKNSSDLDLYIALAESYRNISAAIEEINAATAGATITRDIVVPAGSGVIGDTTLTDYVYFITGAYTMTMPTAVNNTNRYTIKNNYSADITINTTASQTIDGSLTLVLAPSDSVDLISNNANWSII